MVLGYHAIFSCYGFWLPNDPRGSWSNWIASWELFRYGPATKTDARYSVAHVHHDRKKRLEAKEALRYPPVTFNGIQARAIARGFSKACSETSYCILACAIMPDHVHLVVARHERKIEVVVRHLKGFATRQLNEEDIHPLAKYVRDGEAPTPWTKGTGWTTYLDSDEDILGAIRYVENNPVKEGLRPQRWNFVKSYAV
jgi:REP element-mobilizing transposase RayT